MKAFIVLVLLLTLGLVVYQFKKDKNLKKLLIISGTVALIVTSAVTGNILRAIVPLFIAHILLVCIAWGALFVYILTNRYCWWCFILPWLSIMLFLLLEFLGGSRHEMLYS